MKFREKMVMKKWNLKSFLALILAAATALSALGSDLVFAAESVEADKENAADAPRNLLSVAALVDLVTDSENEMYTAGETDEVDTAYYSAINIDDVKSAMLSLLSFDAEEVSTVDAEEESGDISGSCGDNLTWVFDESSGTLTISGTG